MRNPTALIAEDETILRQELRATLELLWPELRVVGEAADGFEALQLMNKLTPDVLFVDVEMPRLNGLEVARQVQGLCHVVFVTAYDAHAVAAFEQGAIDYVLKPFDCSRLAVTVRRIEQRIGTAPSNLEGLLREVATTRLQPSYLRWINASMGNTVRVITTDEVCYFQADAGYTKVVTADADALIQRSMRELQGQLDPAVFWPIHRSTIVNANAIAGVTRDLRGRVTVSLKKRAETLPVSEAHTHLFRQM